MDLLRLMTEGWEDKALDRLEGLLALFDVDDPREQGEALERVMNFCEREWGGYPAGLEALAQRIEKRAADPVQGSMDALRLREEADDPGAIIRAIRARREHEARDRRKREALASRYGSVEAASVPTAFERLFIEATAALDTPEPGGQDGHGESGGDDDQAYGPLDGWHLPWHELPDRLRHAVSEAHPLPDTVASAQTEALWWERRLRDLEIVHDCPAGEGSLPTACAARRKVVVELWRKGLPASTLADLQARMTYWAEWGGQDGTGYRLMLADVQRLAASGGAVRAPESTKDMARSLKARHPEWSLARIGEELGISRQAVHKHLKG